MRLVAPPTPAVGAGSAGVLAELGLPEHAPVEQLRALTRIAATVCRVPTAVVNLLDDCYQHQVSEVGFTGARTDVSTSMCVAALAEPRLRHVPDASREPSFAANPWVDGRLADVRFYASAPLVLADGRVLGSLCVFSDQPGALDDAQRRALQDLAGQAVFLLEQAAGAREAARQAALFRLVAEGSADVLSRHAPDGTVLYVSPSVQDVLGLDQAAQLGTAAGDRVHPDDGPALAAAVAAVLHAQQDCATTRLRSQHADGSWRWLEVQLAPIRDEHGRALELHSVARDVTARVDAEQRLAEVAAQARSVVDTCADAFISIDEAGAVLDWNPTAQATFGWTRDEAVGRDLGELIVPDGLRGAHAAGLARLGVGEDPRILDKPVQTTAQHRDGAVLPVELTVWRSRSAGGWRYNAFLRDVTERQLAQEAARAQAVELTRARDQALAATRAKTAFLAAASHEIRTPLNGVLGALELLSVQDLTSRQAEYVAVAHDSGRALLRLLNDVLDLSKAEATTVVLTCEPLEPLTVARDVVTALGPVADRKGLALHVRSSGGRAVLGDASRLRQVLMNLVGNAIKFTADGSVTVTVDTTAQAGGRVRLRLSVADTGAGMPPDELANLFEPFVQGAQGQRYGGTGLGLALTQQIIDIMDGRIEVSSEPGRGSTFTVVVDLPDAREDVAPAEPARAPSAPGSDPPTARAGIPRVLVADDNDTNLLVAEAMLTVLGAEVDTVSDGDDAVRAVLTRPYDLVLLDHCMPRMSGTDAARAIRALPGAAGRTRLIALTATATPEEQAGFRACGMDRVLVKPVQLADLQQALRTLDAPVAPAAGDRPAQRP